MDYSKRKCIPCNKNRIKRRNCGKTNVKYNLTKEYIMKELNTKSQKELAKEIGCDPSLISCYVKRIKKGGNIYA